MNYSAINIQGNIISSDIVSKIRQDDIRFQKPADFGLDQNTTVRDEIGIAWAASRAHWSAFKLRRDRLKDKQTGTSETRQGWIIPLMRELGYDLEKGNAEIINEKSYAISHRAQNCDNFPVHIVGVNQSLDRRAESGPRLSPHALVQEYLNNHDHLYALISNGSFLRLLRDDTRLARLTFLEFDLEKIMEEELYAEFAILFRLLHISRMPQKQDAGAESIIEFYHQEALSSGTRIRERLSEAVEECIKSLANGLLKQVDNKELHDSIRKEEISADDFYLYLLRVIYRILFLLVTEERNLIFPETLDADLKRKRKIYYDYYSLQRISRLAEKRIYVDPRKKDLWQSLLTTFSLFEEKAFSQKIGISPLSSGLFSPSALGLVSESILDNDNFLSVLRRLVLFENETKQITRVNYADLDVEEFGSVYEGLLEYDPVIDIQDDSLSFGFKIGDSRSSSGSHYTPEELVKPLIKHSLDYIIADKLKEGQAIGGNDQIKKQAQCDALLTITVCDVACGSGHILLSAARRIGMQLAVLRESLDSKSDVEQPSPTYLRAAIRDVIRHCIYGVDLNPLAVELCKVALWLEAHNPNEPLNFLDHHIKNGNAIVGLAHFEELQNGIANEAFKALPGDDKTLASELKKKNTLEKKTAGQLSTYKIAEVDDSLKGLQKDFAQFVTMPENTPEQIAAKTKAYQKLTIGKKWYRLKNLADLQVAQFFIPKTVENKEKLTTEAKYRTYLNTGTQILDRGAAMAMAAEKRFFHWFLEFPEVFRKGGFDCILGNPPYLGGQKISGAYGFDFLEYLKDYFKCEKSPDLVVFFIIRNFTILNKNGFESIITTNSISEGKSREEGLDKLTDSGGEINYAFPSRAWPGKAGVSVALISISKVNKRIPKVLGSKSVANINSYLTDEEVLVGPFKLLSNVNQCFQGYILLGSGFIIDSKVAKHLKATYPEISHKILPYLNGDDLNSKPTLLYNKYSIDVSDLDLTTVKQFEQVYQILLENVYPQREAIVSEKIRKGKKLGVHDLRAKDEWWKYLWPRPELRKCLEKSSTVYTVPLTTKYLNFTELDKDFVFSHAVGVIPVKFNYYLSILNSSLHEEWSRKHSSSLETRLRYTPSNCFETFPFPATYNGKGLFESYDELTKTIKDTLLHHNIGITKFYNLIHDKKNIGSNFHEIRSLINRNDCLVLAAYGWEDIQLRHDFYEVDYLPENDRVRYTIHPDARKEVLKRLLLLNHERFEEEVAKGLHKKKDVVAYFEQKGKPVPVSTTFSDGKKATTKAKANKVEEPSAAYKNQGKLEL